VIHVASEARDVTEPGQLDRIAEQLRAAVTA
jgi:hypothetical protein